MNDDRVAPDDGSGEPIPQDDSPWRPGADVEFDHPPTVSFAAGPVLRERVDERTSAVEQDDPARSDLHASLDRRRVPFSRRKVIASSVVAVLVAMGAIATFGSGGDPLTGSTTAPRSEREAAAVFVDTGGDVPLDGGATPLGSRGDEARQFPRLPAAADEQWTAPLRVVGSEQPQVAFGKGEVVVLAGDVQGSHALIAFDTDDGTETWSRAPLREPSEVALLGVTAGVAVVESRVDGESVRLTGYDATNGSESWVREIGESSAGFIDPRIGAIFVQQPLTEPKPGSVAVLSPQIGEEMTRAAGQFLDIVDTTWLMTQAGDKVLANSLSPDSGTPYVDMIGAVPPDGSPFTLAGRALIAAPSADTLTRSQAVVDANVDRVTRELDLFVGEGLTAPPSVTSLGPIGDSSIVLTGGRLVYGVGIEGTTAEVRWQARGVVVGQAASDRGRTLVTATEGGARQRVLDASTGRTIVNVEMQPGAIQTLDLAANGVVVQQLIDGSAMRVAVDLDGIEMWTLPGSGRLDVGDGIVIDAVPEPDGDGAWTLTAYGGGSPLGGRVPSDG